jgi:hypothetical protein
MVTAKKHAGHERERRKAPLKPLKNLSAEIKSVIQLGHLKETMGNQTSPDFFNGLVFGFDVGTGSIGYAVCHSGEKVSK